MLQISRSEKKNGDAFLEEQESVPEGVSNPKAAMWVVAGLIILPLAANVGW